MTKEDEKIIDEITDLRERFKDKWGQSVFNLPIPCIITTDISLKQLRDILVITIDTGENIMEGYEKYILGRPITINDLVLNNTHTYAKKRYKSRK